MNMRKWIYTTLGHAGTVTAAIEGDTIEAESGTEFYAAHDVDARIAELEKALRSMQCLDPPGCTNIDCVNCKLKTGVL